MLFGRVTDYNTRTNLRGSHPKSQSPFQINGFRELDQLLCVDFLESFPSSYKNLGLSENGNLDTDLYMAHVVPHAYVHYSTRLIYL